MGLPVSLRRFPSSDDSNTDLSLTPLLAVPNTKPMRLAKLPSENFFSAKRSSSLFGNHPPKPLPSLRALYLRPLSLDLLRSPLQPRFFFHPLSSGRNGDLSRIFKPPPHPLCPAQKETIFSLSLSFERKVLTFDSFLLIR